MAISVHLWQREFSSIMERHCKVRVVTVLTFLEEIEQKETKITKVFLVGQNRIFVAFVIFCLESFRVFRGQIACSAISADSASYRLLVKVAGRQISP